VLATVAESPSPTWSASTQFVDRADARSIPAPADRYADDQSNRRKTTDSGKHQHERQADAYSRLLTPVLKPRDAFQRLVHNKAKALPLDELAGRVSGVGGIPYPPGIPIVMPGESFGGENDPWIPYLRRLESWNRLYPGFECELEGVTTQHGQFLIDCLTLETSESG